MLKWTRNHPVLAGVLAFIFGSTPQWLSGTWALFSSEPLFVVIARQGEFARLAYTIFSYAAWPIGITLLVLIWLAARRGVVSTSSAARAKSVRAEPIKIPKGFQLVEFATSEITRPPRAAVVILVLIALLCFVAGWWARGRPRSSPPQVQAAALTDEWPPLTPAEITEWANKLGPLGIKSIQVFWSPDVEAKRLFMSLKEAGHRCGIPVYSMGNGTEVNTIEVMGRPDDTDVLTVVQNLLRKKFPQTKVVIDTHRFASSDREIYINIGQKEP